MKNLYSLFLLTILSTTLFAQTTRRVNGDPNITGVNVYNTIQDAVDAANTDDVILIEPYGANLSVNPIYDETVNVDKRVHIRGNGYFLENSELQIEPIDKRTATPFVINFKIGSDGSSIKNVYISYLYASMDISAPNILIESCRIPWINISSQETASVVISEGKNVTIRKSVVGYLYDNRGQLAKQNSNLNLLFENSIVESGVQLNNSIFKNCYINSLSQSSNSIFTNTIFYNDIVGGGSNFNNAISFCIGFSGGLPTLGNNLNNVVWEQIFKGSSYSAFNSYVFENEIELSNSSLGKNAGINGGDIGIYGGTYPYEKSGLPHHPITTFFINSGIGNNNIDLDAVITLKAN